MPVPVFSFTVQLQLFYLNLVVSIVEVGVSYSCKKIKKVLNGLIAIPQYHTGGKSAAHMQSESSNNDIKTKINHKVYLKYSFTMI